MASVLIVDDATLQQALIRSFLKEEHTIIESVTNGEEAVSLAEEHEPDVVVMDINLPNVDGITAAERIKSHSPETMIIMSTAVVNEEVKALSEEIPIEEYLIKPYSKDELLGIIDATR